jgi:hypothetical protein
MSIAAPAMMAKTSCDLGSRNGRIARNKRNGTLHKTGALAPHLSMKLEVTKDGKGYNVCAMDGIWFTQRANEPQISKP